MSNLAFRRYDATGARVIRNVIESVYLDAYAETIARGDLFDSPETFMRRFDAYISRETFDLVVAYDGDEPLGQTWGWPLDERAGEAGGKG